MRVGRRERRVTRPAIGPHSNLGKQHRLRTAVGIDLRPSGHGLRLRAQITAAIAVNIAAKPKRYCGSVIVILVSNPARASGHELRVDRASNRIGPQRTVVQPGGISSRRGLDTRTSSADTSALVADIEPHRASRKLLQPLQLPWPRRCARGPSAGFCEACFGLPTATRVAKYSTRARRQNGPPKVRRIQTKSSLGRKLAI